MIEKNVVALLRRRRMIYLDHNWYTERIALKKIVLFPKQWPSTSRETLQKMEALLVTTI